MLVEYWSNEVEGIGLREHADLASGSLIDAGQTLVKYWSNTGRSALVKRTVGKHWVMRGAVVKRRSNTGQILAKRRSNTGQSSAPPLSTSISGSAVAAADQAGGVYQV